MDHRARVQERLQALEHESKMRAQQTRTLARQLRWWRGLACALVGLGLLTWALPVVTADDAKKDLEQRVAAVEKLLKHFRRDGNEVFIKGANLHIVNGLGQTTCGSAEEPIPDCPNGLGNLIVGYNELREFEENIRTGSHNVVVGEQHNFSHFGGLVVGLFNTASGDFASVSGGAANTASGHSSVVSSGEANTASGHGSVVSGGRNRTAEGEFDWRAGGLFQDE
jgi:hypothetical protein